MIGQGYWVWFWATGTGLQKSGLGKQPSGKDLSSRRLITVHRWREVTGVGAWRRLVTLFRGKQKGAVTTHILLLTPAPLT